MPFVDALCIPTLKHLLQFFYGQASSLHFTNQWNGEFALNYWTATDHASSMSPLDSPENDRHRISGLQNPIRVLTPILGGNLQTKTGTDDQCEE
jgi:hypothetical protein